MAQAGWQTNLPDDPLPNPLPLQFIGPTTRRLLVYARRITPQSSATSDHGRPVGEMHLQLLFDGDQRGAGVRNQLRFEENTETVVFGFYELTGDYIIAAYDPKHHRSYAYSKSLQVKRWKLEDAARSGIAFQQRQSGEVIVLFRISELPEYLDRAPDFHNLAPSAIDDALTDSSIPPSTRQALVTAATEEQPPQLEAEERKQRFIETAHYVRNRQFRRGILSVYERCAICGFQYDYVLDAAHIVPVADGGTDTYENGLGQCPNCHRMFDKGLILVDHDGHVYLNPRLAEEYDQLGLAGSLETLQATLRETLWLPADPRYHPSPANLRRTFEARR